jgi:hypothetical protein
MKACHDSGARRLLLRRVRFWPDYYRNPCMCTGWLFSSARGSGARVPPPHRSTAPLIAALAARFLEHLPIADSVHSSRGRLPTHFEILRADDDDDDASVELVESVLFRTCSQWNNLYVYRSTLNTRKRFKSLSHGIPGPGRYQPGSGILVWFSLRPGKLRKKKTLEGI